MTSNEKSKNDILKKLEKSTKKNLNFKSLKKKDFFTSEMLKDESQEEYTDDPLLSLLKKQSLLESPSKEPKYKPISSSEISTFGSSKQDSVHDLEQIKKILKRK